MRLSQAARKYNISTTTITECLQQHGMAVDGNPNTKLTADQQAILHQTFQSTSKAPAPAAAPPAAPAPAAGEAAPAVLVPEAPAPVLEGPPVLQPAAEEPLSPFVFLSRKEQEQPAPPEAVSLHEPVPAAPEKPAESVMLDATRTIKVIKPELEGFNVLGRIAVQPHQRPHRPRPEEPGGTFTPSPPATGARPARQTSPPFGEAKPSIFSGRKPRPARPAPPKKKSDRKPARSAQGKKKTSRGRSKEKRITLTPIIALKELAGLLNIPAQQLIDASMELGRLVTIHQRLDKELVTLLLADLGYVPDFIGEVPEEPQTPPSTAAKSKRPPVVTVMGHVDHGKTSLLDYIRQARIADQEAGGITQHIGAYQVTTAAGDKMTFLDTPGHEAFASMRARGAHMTDIVIIVVAADDGVMPQTKEAIQHARLAGLPMIFAISKVDKQGAKPDRVMEQLATEGILVEEYGGTYQVQPIVSARSSREGEGIDLLLERVIAIAEDLDLRADPELPASGVVIESSLDKKAGFLATLLVMEGTLHVGEAIVAGECAGKVKALFDDQGQRISSAGPATPVQVLGLDGAPDTEEPFMVKASEKEARLQAASQKTIQHGQTLRSKKKHLSTLLAELRGSKVTAETFHILLKADTSGSVEAIADTILKKSNDKLQMEIVYKDVGPITEADIQLAAVSGSLLIGFHTSIARPLAALAVREGVTVRQFDTIYQIEEEIEKQLQAREAPVVEEKIVGKAHVIQVFHIPQVGVVAGCQVRSGSIKKQSVVRFLRAGQVLYQGPLRRLQIEREEVPEAKNGSQCAISLKNFQDIQLGDEIEVIELITSTPGAA